VILVINLYF